MEDKYRMRQQTVMQQTQMTTYSQGWQPRQHAAGRPCLPSAHHACLAQHFLPVAAACNVRAPDVHVSAWPLCTAALGALQLRHISPGKYRSLPGKRVFSAPFIEGNFL